MKINENITTGTYGVPIGKEILAQDVHHYFSLEELLELVQKKYPYIEKVIYKSSEDDKP